ncbi:hypothetical protein ACOZ4N_16295 [Halorientalis pallida]
MERNEDELAEIESLTDLRGILAGKTDDEGRTAIELLRESREDDREDAE